jgi:adenylate kinase
MKLVFIGPQGSGKGTQAKIISEKIGFPHISTGDLLRNIQGDLKQEVDNHMNQGVLVPDELMLRILKETINSPYCEAGFILDGFPRNIEQAKELEKITSIDKFIEISISDEEAIKRISGRRNCNQCGKIYNINTSPKPEQENECDACKTPLTQRPDDTEDAVKKRLNVYHNDTEPILKEYPSIKIKGEQDIKDVTRDILEKLSE